jgi:activator of HSP90 ATPase
MDHFKITANIPAPAIEVYNAWLDSEQHSEMTGGVAVCSTEAGDEFSAWDGYITGTNEVLIPGKKIVQNWRTEEFEDDDADTLLTLTFQDTKDGCELTLLHENLPIGESDYEQGWNDHYFEPMKTYFSKK